MSGWLVTGAGGMLGQDLVSRLRREGTEVTGLARRDLDVTDAAAVRGSLQRVRPEVAVNCAAWTAADAAEGREDEALAVNGAVRPTWPWCALPWVHGCCTCPRITCLTVRRRGRTRRMRGRRRAALTGAPSWPGSRRCSGSFPGAGYVLRTSWLYGAHEPNFVRTMIRLERAQPEVGGG